MNLAWFSFFVKFCQDAVSRFILTFKKGEIDKRQKKGISSFFSGIIVPFIFWVTRILIVSGGKRGCSQFVTIHMTPPDMEMSETSYIRKDWHEELVELTKDRFVEKKESSRKVAKRRKK